MADVTNATPQMPLPWENAVVSSSGTTQLPVFGAQCADLVVRESMDVVSRRAPDRVSKPAGRVLSPPRCAPFSPARRSGGSNTGWGFRSRRRVLSGTRAGCPQDHRSELPREIGDPRRSRNRRDGCRIPRLLDGADGGYSVPRRRHRQGSGRSAKNWSPSTWTKRPRRSSPPRWNSMFRARSEECRCAVGSTCWTSRGGLWI